MFFIVSNDFPCFFRSNNSNQKRKKIVNLKKNAENKINRLEWREERVEEKKRLSTRAHSEICIVISLHEKSVRRETTRQPRTLG